MEFSVKPWWPTVGRCLSPVEVLADIITQVDGRATIMVDSGFSNGLDIARGIALGADFVFVAERLCGEFRF